MADTEIRVVWIDARVDPNVTRFPSAVAASLERDLSAPNDPKKGGRHPLPRLADWCVTVGRWGITPDTEVRVFDDKNGGLAAARCWWMLRAIGHSNVDVVSIDDVPTEGRTSRPKSPYPALGWLAPTSTLNDVRRALKDPTRVVIDARDARRFRGEWEPIDPVPGALPGAVNVPWEEVLDLETAYDRITTVLKGRAPTSAIVHCGSGITACSVLLQMHRLGLRGASLYVGSYSEWCRQDDESASS